MIEDREELPHTGDEGDFLRLAEGEEPLLEGPSHRIRASDTERTSSRGCGGVRDGAYDR